MLRTIIILLVATVTLVTVSCGLDKKELPSKASSLSVNSSKLVIEKKYLWPSSNIPVCFPNGDMYPNDVTAIKALLVGEFSLVGITFDFQTYCPPSRTRGVRIAVYDSSDDIDKICAEGTLGCAVLGGVRSLKNGHYGENLALWLPKGWHVRDVKGWYLYESAVIHEFGHILGAHHEHERLDAIINSECRKLFPKIQTGTLPENSNIRYATPFDNLSVMSYCNIFVNGGPYLSGSDIYGFGKYYSKIPSPTPNTPPSPEPSTRPKFPNVKSISGTWIVDNNGTKYKIIQNGTSIELCLDPDTCELKLKGQYLKASSSFYASNIVVWSGGSSSSLMEGYVANKNGTTLEVTYKVLSDGVVTSESKMTFKKVQ